MELTISFRDWVQYIFAIHELCSMMVLNLNNIALICDICGILVASNDTVPAGQAAEYVIQKIQHKTAPVAKVPMVRSVSCLHIYIYWWLWYVSVYGLRIHEPTTKGIIWEKLQPQNLPNHCWTEAATLLQPPKMAVKQETPSPRKALGTVSWRCTWCIWLYGKCSEQLCFIGYNTFHACIYITL